VLGAVGKAANWLNPLNSSIAAGKNVARAHRAHTARVAERVTRATSAQAKYANTPVLGSSMGQRAIGFGVKHPYAVGIGGGLVIGDRMVANNRKNGSEISRRDQSRRVVRNMRNSSASQGLVPRSLGGYA
jgi:hypothetical protein